MTYRDALVSHRAERGPIDTRPRPGARLRRLKEGIARALESGTGLFAYARILAARYGAPFWLFFGVLVLFALAFWFFAAQKF